MLTDDHEILDLICDFGKLRFGVIKTSLILIMSRFSRNTYMKILINFKYYFRKCLFIYIFLGPLPHSGLEGHGDRPYSNED